MRRCRIVIWCNPPQVMQTDMKLGKLKLADANSPKIQSSECTAGCSWLESFREQSLEDRYRELYMNYKVYRRVLLQVVRNVALMFFNPSNSRKFSLQLLRWANGHVRPLMIWFDLNCKLLESSGRCGPINENSQECRTVKMSPTFLMAPHGSNKDAMTHQKRVPVSYATPWFYGFVI